jgi:hypothetical protein
MDLFVTKKSFVGQKKIVQTFFWGAKNIFWWKKLFGANTFL